MISHAQWQWVDKDGRKVFSDQPPPFDIPEKNITKSPRAYQNRAASNAATAAAVAASSAGSSNNGAPASPGATGATGATAPTASAASAPAPQLARDKDLEEKKKQAEDEVAAKKKAVEDANAKARAGNCKLAREGKATLDSGVRISRTNSAGEREIMDDAARQVEAKRLQAIMTTDCGAKS